MQFVHRWLAFAVAAAALVLAGKALRRGLEGPAYALMAVITVQILLGIATLLSGVNIVIAVSHQANAVLLLIVMLWAGHALGSARQEVPA